jgi:hypothetical protein
MEDVETTDASTTAPPQDSNTHLSTDAMFLPFKVTMNGVEAGPRLGMIPDSCATPVFMPTRVRRKTYKKVKMLKSL